MNIALKKNPLALEYPQLSLSVPNLRLSLNPESMRTCSRAICEGRLDLDAHSEVLSKEDSLSSGPTPLSVWLAQSGPKGIFFLNCKGHKFGDMKKMRVDLEGVSGRSEWDYGQLSLYEILKKNIILRKIKE